MRLDFFMTARNLIVTKIGSLDWWMVGMRHRTRFALDEQVYRTDPSAILIE